MPNSHANPLVHCKGTLAQGNVGEAQDDEDCMYAATEEHSHILTDSCQEAVVHKHECWYGELVALFAEDTGTQAVLPNL